MSKESQRNTFLTQAITINAWKVSDRQQPSQRNADELIPR